MQKKKSSKYLNVYKKNRTWISQPWWHSKVNVFLIDSGVLIGCWENCHVLQLGSEIEGSLLFVICSKKTIQFLAKIDCLQWYWSLSPLNSSQNISYNYYWSYQNKQLYLHGNWQLFTMIGLKQMKTIIFVCLIIVEGQWNAKHCLITQFLVQSDKCTMKNCYIIGF